LAQYGDLYAGPNGLLPDHLGSFDNMAGAGGSHPSAYTKRALGWIDDEAVATHLGRFELYDLHDVGLPQPPPIGRASAIEVGSLIIEAREMVDQFDAGIRASTTGASPQGVIVYDVESHDIADDDLLHPLIRLKTPDPIQPGGLFRFNGVTVQVLQNIPGGYTVRVDDLSQPLEFRSGQLLFYRDETRNGTGDVNTPSVIGLGGWQAMQHLTYGGDGILYAVDDQGRLLFYRDFKRDGTGDVNSPAVIGLGGWASMLHLFAGDPGVLYAVNPDGQLLFYRDNTRNGTGDVNTPSVIGLGGWQNMQHLFYGGDGIIYAVDDQGQLLFYRDATRDGTGDVNTPSVIGLGGWQNMQHLFYGGDGIIYAVDGDGQLLFYRDTTRNGTGDVNTPAVIGLGGWQVMKHLVCGDPGVIYAVVR
jgi:Tachylectin